jgi:phage N-6-adenine-methyltransferase
VPNTTPRLAPGVFSSRTDEWYTPQPLVDALAKHYADGRFVLDAAATAASAKAATYYDAETDALTQDWHAKAVQLGGGVCYLNPPFSKAAAFVAKAAETARAGTPVVVLIPARTDTGWWHTFAMTAAEIVLIQGRLRFHRFDGTAGASAPFPNAVLVFRPGTSCLPRFATMTREGEFLCRQAPALHLTVAA